jgi:pyruvate kinase
MDTLTKSPSATPNVFKRTKILATVGPSVDSYEKLLALIKNGTNGFRLNFSHGTYEERTRQIEWIRKASEEAGKAVAILQDLQGPKIRLGDFEGTINLKTDEVIRLGYQTDYAKSGIIPTQYDLSTKVKAGERIFLFDGRIKSTVTDVKDAVVSIKIANDGYVMKRKGINLPDTDFGGDIFTEKDLKDIEFGATQDIDYVAMSFVQSPDDMDRLRDLLKKHGSDAHTVAKVETQAAVAGDTLEKIVQASDCVMVARGDLAVEVSAEAVPIIQRKIIGFCQQYAKISIVATQMMISMVENPEPTRAEVSDVAGAVITGADCVMLSDETANGKYPVETVTTMSRVILYTQQNADLNPVFYGHGIDDLQDAISSAVMTLAHQIDAVAIIAETKSGMTALSIASHRPNMSVVAVTSVKRVCQQLALMFASNVFVRPDDATAGLQLAQWLKEQNALRSGDRVVIVSGRQPGLIGGTDTIKVRVLE